MAILIRRLLLWGILLHLFLSCDYPYQKDEKIPIYFKEYGVQIYLKYPLSDTIYFNKSSSEDFKFVFFDVMGKSYCERYIKGKLFEKGNFANSLDTLKSYKAGSDLNENFSKIQVYKYFQPLKDGEWVIYKSGEVIKEYYKLGILQEDQK